MNVLDAINWCSRAYGYPPTQREIAEVCGISERAVRKRLGKLQEAGEVTWEPGKKRTVKTTSKKAAVERKAPPRKNMKGKSIPMS